MPRFSFLAISLMPVILAMACSTPRTRIKENEKQFNYYPAQVQAQIQSGRIDRGFTPEMVYMAMGSPAEKIKRSGDKGKEIEVWMYPGPMVELPGQQGSSGFSGAYGYPSFGPGPSHPVQSQTGYRKHYKVEFESGKVVRWDSELQAQ